MTVERLELQVRPQNLLPRLSLYACAGLCALSLGACSLDTTALNSALKFLDPPSIAASRAARVSQLTSRIRPELLHEQGVLTVGIKAADSVPLVATSSTGELSGIHVDVAYTLADYLGVSRVVFKTVATAKEGLEHGCDLVMGAVASDGSDLDIVGDYAESGLAVFSRLEKNKIIDAQQLASKRVGVQAGSVSEQAISKLSVDVTAQSYANLNDAFSALDTGSVDFVVCDALAGSYLAMSYERITFSGTLDTPQLIGVALSSEKAELSAAVRDALLTLQKNGLVAIARAQWIGNFPTLTEATKIARLTTQ